MLLQIVTFMTLAAPSLCKQCYWNGFTESCDDDGYTTHSITHDLLLDQVEQVNFNYFKLFILLPFTMLGLLIFMLCCCLIFTNEEHFFSVYIQNIGQYFRSRFCCFRNVNDTLSPDIELEPHSLIELDTVIINIDNHGPISFDSASGSHEPDRPIVTLSV